MKSIILIAPPAAGKGTQAYLLSKKYNIPHISTGSMLREEMKAKTEIGLKIEQDMELGNLIDDNLIVKLLNNRLKSDDCKSGYILDGFPRTLRQAELYNLDLIKTNKKIDYVFYLNLNEEEAYKRTVSRLICNSCQTSYSDIYENLMPKIDGLCNQCGEELIRRSDDNLKTFGIRFKNYLQLTKPLIDYYKDKNMLYEIDSSVDSDAVFKQLTNIIDGVEIID